MQDEEQEDIFHWQDANIGSFKINEPLTISEYIKSINNELIRPINWMIQEMIHIDCAINLHRETVISSLKCNESLMIIEDIIKTIDSKSIHCKTFVKFFFVYQS